MATLIPLYNMPVQFMDSDGDPLSGGTLNFYLSGTTTATELYDSNGTSIGTSITLNSWGMPESGGNTITLFRNQALAIKIVGKNASGATIFTSDGIPAVASYDSTASTKLGTIEESADVTDATNVKAAGAYMIDGTNALTADITMPATKFINDCVTAGITASITQTQGNGELISAYNEVSTVTTANDTVTLPATKAGRQVVITNNGANTLQIFPASGSYIDARAVDASTTLEPGESAIFKAYTALKWETISATHTPAYGTMSVQGNASAEATTDATPRPIALWDTDGLASNMTVDSTTDNDITAGLGGKYLVNLDVSFSGTASKTFAVEIYKNGAATGFSLIRKLGTGGDVGSASCHGMVTLAAGDTLTTYQSSTDGGTAFTLVDGQLTAYRVST